VRRSVARRGRAPGRAPGRPAYHPRRLGRVVGQGRSGRAAVGRLVPGGPGLHTALLDGPSAADFDLYLFQYLGGNWTQVGKATTGSSDETLEIDADGGYFAWLVYSYSGAGSYTISMTVPE
jgi:hypothetical protein